MEKNVLLYQGYSHIQALYLVHLYRPKGHHSQEFLGWNRVLIWPLWSAEMGYAFRLLGFLWQYCKQNSHIRRPISVEIRLCDTTMSYAYHFVLEELFVFFYGGVLRSLQIYGASIQRESTAQRMPYLKLRIAANKQPVSPTYLLPAASAVSCASLPLFSSYFSSLWPSVLSCLLPHCPPCWKLWRLVLRVRHHQTPPEIGCPEVEPRLKLQWGGERISSRDWNEFRGQKDRSARPLCVVFAIFAFFFIVVSLKAPRPWKAFCWGMIAVIAGFTPLSCEVSFMILPTWRAAVFLMIIVHRDKSIVPAINSTK